MPLHGENRRGTLTKYIFLHILILRYNPNIHLIIIRYPGKAIIPIAKRIIETFCIPKTLLHVKAIDRIA